MVLSWINKWTWNISECIRELLETRIKPATSHQGSPKDVTPPIVDQPPGSQDESGEIEAVELTAITGIGRTYEARLNEAGINDVADLLDADVDSLAESTGISPNLLSKWIEYGREL